MDSWTECLKLRNKCYFNKLEEDEVKEEINTILFPILQILEEEDFPVEKVFWSTSCRSIDLKREVFLTPKVLQRIVDHLGSRLGSMISSSISGNSIIYFYFSWHFFSIYNGKGVCRFKKVTTEVEVPAQKKVETKWELDGECSSLEELEKEIENVNGQGI